VKKLSMAAALGAACLAALIAVSLSSGSSHREAPNIMLDPSADTTDTYAFTANDAQASLTVVANWVPGGNPANGPNFFRFDDRARYYINIDNTGDGKADIRYRYVFKTKVSNSSYRHSLVGTQSFEDPRLLPVAALFDPAGGLRRGQAGRRAHDRDRSAGRAQQQRAEVVSRVQQGCRRSDSGHW